MTMELANLLCRAVIAISAVFIACYINEIRMTVELIRRNLSTANERLLELTYRQEYISEIAKKLDRIANAVEDGADRCAVLMENGFNETK